MEAGGNVGIEWRWKCYRIPICPSLSLVVGSESLRHDVDVEPWWVWYRHVQCAGCLLSFIAAARATVFLSNSEELDIPIDVFQIDDDGRGIASISDACLIHVDESSATIFVFVPT